MDPVRNQMEGSPVEQLFFRDHRPQPPAFPLPNRPGSPFQALLFRQIGTDQRMGRMLQFLDRPLGDHLPSAGSGLRPHFHQMIGMEQHLGIVIHQHHRIAVSDQIIHDPGQSLQVIGMETNGWLIQDIEYSCGPVPYGPGQLHPLPLPGGKGGSGPIRGKIPQAQVKQPFRCIQEGFTDTPGHGNHGFLQGGRHPLHPFHQIIQGHGRCLVQANAPQPGGPGGFTHTGAMAVRTFSFFQVFVHPFHAFFILHLGQRILHRIHGTVIGEIQFSHLMGFFVHIVDMLFHHGAVEDNVLLLIRQVLVGHVCAHAHLPAYILHQGPHEGAPHRHGPLIDGQIFIGDQGGFVHCTDNPRTPTGGTGSPGIERQILRPRSVKFGPAYGTGDFLHGRHGQGRRAVVAVGTAVAGQTGEHQAQGVGQL